MSTRHALTISAALLCAAAQAQQKPDTTPIDWGNAVTPAQRWPMAAAIVDSYGVHAARCEHGLRAVGLQRLNQQEREACAKSLDMGVPGSRYRQAADVITSVKPGDVDPAQIRDFNRTLDVALEGQRRWLFIREQLIRR